MGPLGSAPAAGVDGGGATYVYWEGTDQNLWEAFWNGSQWVGPYNHAVVLGGKVLDQRGDLGADRRPSHPAGIGPVPGDQAAVPPQHGSRRDQPVRPQPSGQEPDQHGEDRVVGPVQPGPRSGAAQHGDLVPQHQQFRVFDAEERPSRTSQPQTRMKMR
jgi:hypothetical protein